MKRLGIGIPSAAVRGTVPTKGKLRRQIEVWVKRRQLVATRMAWKGFREEEVEMALAECNKMIQFYIEVLENLE